MATKTVEVENCPGCGARAKVQGSGRRWQVVCSKNNQTLFSPCQKAGHTMFTKAEAVRVWNETK